MNASVHFQPIVGEVWKRVTPSSTSLTSSFSLSHDLRSTSPTPHSLTMEGVAQWLESPNSNLKTLGSIPWRGRVRDNFSVPPSQLLCRLLCAYPPFVCTAHTQMCPHVKDPISMCRKRVGLTASDMETQKHCTQKERKKAGLLAFPRKSSPSFPCIALGQDSYLI